MCAALLVDTDIFVLLAGAGLLDRTAELLNCSPDDLRRLDPVTHQLRKSKKFLEKYSAEVRAAALQAARRVRPLTDRPVDDTLLQRLADIPDIEEGDAFLLASVAEHPSWLLTTGDRRAIIACATNPEARKVRKAVAGRIVPIETVLRLLVTTDGIGKIAPAFINVREYDKKLRVIFSEAGSTNLEHCLAGIDSNLRSLVRHVGDDFLYMP